MFGKISSLIHNGVRTGLSSVKAGHTQKMPTESLAEILYGTLVKEGITSAREFNLRADELIEDVRELSSFVGGIDEKAFSEIKHLALEKFRARNKEHDMQYIYKVEAFAQNKESANYPFSGIYTNEQEAVNIYKAILERARQSQDCISFQGQVVKLTRVAGEDHGFTCTKFVKQPGAIVESDMLNFSIDTKALTAQKSLGNKSKVVEQGLKNTVANNTKTGVTAKVISTPVHKPPTKEEPAQKPRSFDF